jgi:hypothetical protein
MATNRVVTYSPAAVSCTFGGIILEGWDSISITKDVPDFKTIMGIRGKNTRVASKNSAATIQVELVQSSYINEVFGAILKADRNRGDMRIQILIKDILGSEIFVSDDTYVEGAAEREYSADMGTRRWVLKCLSSRESDSGSSVLPGSPLVLPASARLPIQ